MPTPNVSKRSSVAPTSRIDFTPAHTTAIGVRANVMRSADSSKVWLVSRWPAAHPARREPPDACPGPDRRGPRDRGGPVVLHRRGRSEVASRHLDDLVA